jgi:hypothetical protein
MQGAHLLESISVVFHQSIKCQMEAMKTNSGKCFACLENVFEVIVKDSSPLIKDGLHRYGPENVEPRLKVVIAILLGYPALEEHICRERVQRCCPARSQRRENMPPTRARLPRAGTAQLPCLERPTPGLRETGTVLGRARLILSERLPSRENTQGNA